MLDAADFIFRDAREAECRRLAADTPRLGRRRASRVIAHIVARATDAIAAGFRFDMMRYDDDSYGL